MARPLAQRLAALTVVAALMAGLSVPAFAATYNIGDGSITIEANGDGTAKVTQNETVNEKDDDVIVKGSGETTSNVIEVINNTEDDLKITLSDVDIADTKGKAPLSVSGTGDTTIELDGNNSLTGSGWSAGLERNEEKDSDGNVTSGKLNSHLADIDKQAEDMFLRLVEQIANREGVTEQLKAENQIEWVGRMNNIRSRAMEIVNAELIYTEKTQ